MLYVYIYEVCYNLKKKAKIAYKNEFKFLDSIQINNNLYH